VPATQPPVRSLAATPPSAAFIGLTPDEERAVKRALAGKTALLAESPRARDAAVFAAAALAAPRPVLVASPLAAQLAASAQKRGGVEVALLSGASSAAERAAVKKRLARGGTLLLVVEPAQLFDSELRQLVAKAPLALVGVAAAHACSEHAHELSPGYLSLREARRALGATVLATCTRTSERVVEQVLEAIGGDPAGLIRSAPPELELRAQVVRPSERKAALFAAIQAHGAPGVVLAATPQEVDGVFAELNARGITAVRLHSAMAPHERSAALERFASLRERLVLVTQSPHACAAGLAGCSDAELGIGSAPPRADLAFVVHYQAPLSPEQLFEDLAWLPPGAHSLVLADSSDAALVQALLAQQRVKPAAIEAVAQALLSAPSDRPLFSDTLALRAGTSRRSAERVLSALGDRNLILRDNGQIARAQAVDLAAEARLLSARFATLRAADAQRAEAIAQYVTSRHQATVDSAAGSSGVALRG
jgi:superfamily II DNA helicase RecQ